MSDKTDIRISERASLSGVRGGFPGKRKFFREILIKTIGGKRNNFRKIMVLKVCVGSSCHLKGSYDVIVRLQELIKKYDLEDKIELQASFCLGECADGVAARADEIALRHVSPENIEEVFMREVYPRVK